MFKNNTSNQIIDSGQNIGNALAEIIIIVVVSFVLGWVARWVWDKVMDSKEYNKQIVVLDEVKAQNQDISKIEIIENLEAKSEIEKEDEKAEIKIKKSDPKSDGTQKREEENQDNIIKESEKKLESIVISPAGIKNDNLKIVEGIGPKIESLLKRRGIENWKDLSEKNSEELKGILKEAGDRFAFHNPVSWPEQAALAQKGKWNELEEFQDFLSGGKKL